MKKLSAHAPETPATRLLKQHKVAYSTHLYAYEAHGGTRVSSRELNLPEHEIVKTLIMENEKNAPFIVLMHGDHKVSTKELARQMGSKHVENCLPEVAQRHSGYLVGGTSPFATRKKMPVFMEKTILNMGKVYINGGKRGFLVGLSPRDIILLLEPTLVNVAI